MDILSQFKPEMAPPSSRWMGMKLVDHRPEEMYSKVTFETNEHMINFSGVIQGGFLAAMMDDATGFNTFISLNMQQTMASINLNTQFLQAVQPGVLTVEAFVIRAGKSVAFVEAKLYDSENELSAAMTASVKLRPSQAFSTIWERIKMADFTLYAIVESGNAYKPALMMELCGADWESKWINFFKGEHKSPEFLAINEMGEIPVLVDHTSDDLTLSQSGVMLYHLADKFKKFAPETEEEKREVMRWILFDNHKLTGNVSAYRVLNKFMGKGDAPEGEFIKGRMVMALNTLNDHLEGREWVAADRPTIADISLCGYLFWPDHFDVTWDDYPNIKAWLERIAALPNYKTPEEILPSGPDA